MSTYLYGLYEIFLKSINGNTPVILNNMAAKWPTDVRDNYLATGFSQICVKIESDTDTVLFSVKYIQSWRHKQTIKAA